MQTYNSLHAKIMLVLELLSEQKLYLPLKWIIKKLGFFKLIQIIFESDSRTLYIKCRNSFLIQK